MSANLEKAIHEGLRGLTDEQQRQVIAFVESLKPKTEGNGGRFSFVGIARSGNGSLSTKAESIFEDGADRREGCSLG